MTPNLGGHVISTELQAVDDYWLSQPNLDLYLAMGPVHWCWKRVRVEGNEIHVHSYPEVK